MNIGTGLGFALSKVMNQNWVICVCITMGILIGSEI